MHAFARRVGLAAIVLSLTSCGSESSTDVPATPAGHADGGPSAVVLALGMTPTGKSDPDHVRAADYSILFVGNSHTMMENLPNLVGEMIQFRQPGKSVYTRVHGVGFLEDTARDPRCKEEIETRPWKFVVLQAQKISMSGKYQYSRREGIDLAKLAKGRGATVLFYPEWGRKGVAGDGARQQQVYREMAKDAGVGFAPVPTAWDLALAGRPELPLHAGDGNHQSAVGAYLTATVLTARLTGQSPAELAAFPYPSVNAEVRKFLADAAARAIAAWPNQ